MDLPGVKRRRRGVTQPVEEREVLAGLQSTSPFPKVTETVNDEPDISIRTTSTDVPSVENGAAASGVGALTSKFVSSDDEGVVDMQQTRRLQNCVNIRERGLLEKDLSINVRQNYTSCNTVRDEGVDLQAVEEVEELAVKNKQHITYGKDEDIIQLLNDTPTQRGVICQEQQVLHCEGGMYMENKQYKVIPGTRSKGAFGEAAMCQDLKTGKTFMRKTVRGKLSRNEIEVPVKFRGNVGIPEVYGVNIQDQGTEIFQEFAGMSLKMVKELRPDCAKQLCDPKMVMVLAFQAFATLHKLHSQGVTHQDIKPENICLDIQPDGVWHLKFIDFGSSQTPKDQVIEGLTNEYLSPESSRTILQIATEKLARHEGRLGPGTDVWALSLSLLYCLCGYHVMVYVCTGHTIYLEQDPNKLQHLRMQCLIKICSLTDEDVKMKLIHPDWPDVLKTLLVNTLRVDPCTRWSAKDAAEFILRNWILRGSGAGVQSHQPTSAVTPAVTPAVPAVKPVASPVTPVPSAAVARSVMFRGLAPPKLVFQTQPPNQRSHEVEAMQCTSPGSAGSPAPSPSPSSSSSSADTPSPVLLPDFTHLLSNTTTKKPQRRCRGKQRSEPYHPPARRGSKN